MVKYIFLALSLLGFGVVDRALVLQWDCDRKYCKEMSSCEEAVYKGLPAASPISTAIMTACLARMSARAMRWWPRPGRN